MRRWVAPSWAAYLLPPFLPCILYPACMPWSIAGELLARRSLYQMNSLRGKGLAILAIVLCVAYFGYRFYVGGIDAAVLKEEAVDRSIQRVSIINPKLLPPTESITLPGNIQAWYEAQIYAQVTGYVKMWYKDYGAIVKQGDILADINAPALDAQYSQAKADLETERAKYVLAELTAKRYVNMRQHQAVSEQAISVQVQEAKAQAARVN